MAIVLALVASLSYGISDFIGGLVSRRTSAWSVAVVGALSTGVASVVVAAFVPGEPRAADFAWGALAGIGSGGGVGFLYRGFSRGRMGVVAPVSAVGAAVVPTVAGLVGGERPGLLVWLGILVAAPAIVLVSAEPRVGEGGRPATSGVTDGVLAGLSFGLLFAALGQVPREAGLWPAALANCVSVLAVVALAATLRVTWWPRERVVWWALATGPFGTAAVVLFLLATQRGFLTVAGVLTSLYPAATVLLAVLFLREQVHRLQAVGLLLCAVTVALVAAG